LIGNFHKCPSLTAWTLESSAKACTT
jgi:hypothetical protein